MQAAPAGGLLGHGTGARQGLHIHVGIWDLGAAELLSESFPAELTATGLMWTCEDPQSPLLRGHKARWERYMAQEGLNDTRLREEFFVVCKVGGPPLYSKCMTCAGDCAQGLTLLENYMLWASQQTDLVGLPASMTYHNASSVDLTEWLAEAQFAHSTVGEKHHPALQLHNIVLPDFRRPILEVHQDHDKLQVVLAGNLWRCRNLLGGFQCGYRHRVTKQECEKGTEAEFVRFTEAFPKEELLTWLEKIPQTIFWLEGPTTMADLAVWSGTPQLAERFPLLVPGRGCVKYGN